MASVAHGVYYSDIRKGNLRLLKSGQYSDFTIVCGQHQFEVHRAIVCPHSTFLDKAVSIGFKETRDCVVRLPEDDPKAVARVIYYCYSGEAEMDSEFYEYFDFEESDPAELVTEARCIIDAYLTADKLLVSNLAQQLWESLRCRLLHAEIAAKLAEINSILRYVYAECPDRRIRLLVVYFTISAMKRAQASLDYLKQPLDKIPGFAWDYVRMDKFITSHDMVCTVCKKTFGLARTGYCKCGGLGFCCNYCSITHEACPYCKAPASIW